MFVIPQRQLEAFHEAGLHDLEEKLARHVRESFPAQCAPLSPDALRAAVRQALARALDHGLAFERDLGAYVDLAFAFGPDFETNPELPWAHLLTTGAPELPPGARLHECFLAAIESLEVS